MTEENFFSVGGENIQFEIKLLNILDLKYYPQNPRISSILERFEGKATQEDIEREMWDKLEYITHDLYIDIKESGGLQDEIIVHDDEVLEGNSRLCAYRHLYKNDPDKEKWKYIRAKVIKTPLTHKLLNTLLCQQHIKGKKDWDAYEKAAYMARMNEDDQMEPEDIAKLTNFSVNEVKNHIKAYKLMKSEGVTDLKEFSTYLEKVKLEPHLGSIRKVEPDIDSTIIKWIKEKKIPEARDIRKLPLIIKDKKARTVFEKKDGDFDEAFVIAKKRNPSIEDTFYRKIDETIDLLRKAKPEERREEIEIDKRKKAKIKNLSKEVKKFCRNLGLEK